VCHCLQGTDSSLELYFGRGALREHLGRQQMDCSLKELIEVVALCDDRPCNGWKHAYEARFGVLGCP